MTVLTPLERLAARAVWRPTPQWEGRRWELSLDGLICGRVCAFTGGAIDAAALIPKFLCMGPFESMAAAGRALLEHWLADEAALPRYRKQFRMLRVDSLPGRLGKLP